MRLPRASARTTVVAVVSTGALVAVGLVVAFGLGDSPIGGSLAAPGEAPPPAVLSTPSLKHNNRLPLHKRLVFQVSNGALTQVHVAEPSGQQIPGSFDASHSSWRSIASFAPLTDLIAKVTYADLAHHVTTRQLSIRSTNAKHRLTALLSPGNGDTVGIAQPVAAIFNYDVPERMRAAVEGRLKVTTHPHVVGAWHWMSAREVHWRPPAYWKPGTAVTISANLQGLDFGHGLWGAAGGHRTAFKIGDSHIAEVNVATHTMHVYDNGKLIKTFPVSTGRDQYPTMGGIHIALEKAKVVVMDSATVGIPKGNPDYYYETVYWDVRISNGGEFVHAAPWSVASQGFTNVSHGCVNLSTVNAEWFYNWATRGDVIDVFNAVRPPSSTDPGTSDWNMTWKQWLAGGAAPSHAARAIHAGLASTGEPVFDPKPANGAGHHQAKQDGTQNQA
ncbi:MAG TPA: Ig-like domain-containing protein [Mycobacteriales bacterium]|nr:Ig-like domain-containing protein [Mycobacteriales bacterium]